jgi:SAM-dependent methyltransferase
MSGQVIRFDDGAAYERGMGAWSQIAGKEFLIWVAPPAGLNWIDIGCGNGAFTELLIRQCAAASVVGIDPSAAQLDYARTRPGTAGATFQPGDAMALPVPDKTFDAATMALVLFFVPDPAKGVAEMARVVRPGGIVAAYAWNFTTGGFPFSVIQNQLRAHGIAPPLPPNAGVAQETAMRAVWTGAGLTDVETRTITVQRSFADFDDFWSASTSSGALKPTLAALPDGVIDRMKTAIKAQLPVDAAGRVTHTAWAAAVKGRVAGA